MFCNTVWRVAFAPRGGTHAHGGGTLILRGIGDVPLDRVRFSTAQLRHSDSNRVSFL